MAGFVPPFTSDIMYSSQNEDYQAELALIEHVLRKIDRDGAKPPELRVLMIASAGENILSVSTSKHIKNLYAIDINEAELHLAELRRTSAIHFNQEQQLRLIGGDKKIARAQGEVEREALFSSLREFLPEATRAYWDQHIEEVKFGLQHVGRNEQVNHHYQLELQKFGLDPIARPKETLAHPGWRQAMESVLSVERYFSIIQYPPQAVAQILDKVGEEWRGLEKIQGFERKLGATTPLPRDNYFLTTVFDNYYAFDAPNEAGLPLYIQTAGISKIKELGVGPERVKLVKGDVFEQIDKIARAEGKFHLISVSNIPDWMSDEEFESASVMIARNLVPGGAFLGRMALLKFQMANIMKLAHLEVDEQVNEALKDVERSSWWGQVTAGFAPSRGENSQPAGAQSQS